MRLFALLLTACSYGQSIGGGVSITGSNSMGYDSPIVGGFVRGQLGPIRAIGEVDNSQKWWVKDGLSWRTVATLDSPSWNKLALLAVGGVNQHRNSQWVKTGGFWGGGLRYGPGYSWYSPADTSMNRVRRWVSGVELQQGPIWVNYEVGRFWFCCTGGTSGWEVGMRLGWLYSK